MAERAKMKKELKTLLTASSFFILATGLFAPIYAVFVEEIGGNLLTAGGAYAAFAIADGVLIYFISRWEDHVKHQEKLIFLGYLLSSIGFFGYLFIRTPIHLFLVQILLGIGDAVITPAYDGVYSKHLDKGKFISEWGMWESMYWIITGISALVGGLIANTYGFRILFVIMFLMSLAGLVLSLGLIIKKKRFIF